MISDGILLRMENVSDKTSRTNQNTFYFNFFLIPVLYEVMRKNTVEPGRPQMKIWCMRITSNTLSEYVLFIAFPLQHLLARRRLNVTFTPTLSALLYFITLVLNAFGFLRK
jgi:hypothetical protein